MLKGLGDYPYGSVPDRHTGVKPRANGGPVITPIIPPDPAGGGAGGGGSSCCDNTNKRLQNKDGSKSLGEMLEKQNQFLGDAIASGLGVKSFIFATGAPVNVPSIPSGGSPTRLATGIINEGFYGVMQTFQLSVDPAGALQDITVQIRVSKEVQSKLTANSLSMDDDGQDIPFYLEVQPGRTIEIWALNMGTLAVYATGNLKGFMRPLK